MSEDNIRLYLTASDSIIATIEEVGVDGNITWKYPMCVFMMNIPGSPGQKTLMFQPLLLGLGPMDVVENVNTDSFVCSFESAKLVEQYLDAKMKLQAASSGIHLPSPGETLPKENSGIDPKGPLRLIKS